MSSYTKLFPQAFLTRNSFADELNIDNPIKIIKMRTRKDSNLFNVNEYTSSVNPFPNYNSPPVLRYMNEGGSASLDQNKSNFQKSESKDVSNNKIQYRIIRNYHKVFLKEKHKKYPTEYISNLVKLLGKKDKNYKLKRMLLSGNEEEGEGVEKDFSNKLSQITQNIISNNITKYSSTGKILYEHTPILETATEEGNLNTHSKLEESNVIYNHNESLDKDQKALKEKDSENQQTKELKETRKLNKNLSSKDALESKFPKTNRDKNSNKPRGLGNLNFISSSNKENNEEKTKSTIELENSCNLNSTEQNKKNPKFSSNKQNNKNSLSSTAITNNNNNNSNKANKHSDFSSDFNLESETNELNKLLKLAQETYSSQEFLSKVELRKSSNRNTLIKSLDFANEENKKMQKFLEQQADKEEPNNSNIYKYFRVFEDKQNDKSPFPKIEKRFFIKKENDERKVKLLKQKEERLDKLFNQELDYSKILKENIENLKSKFYKPNKYNSGEINKFRSFYGQVQNITSRLTWNASRDEKISFDFTDYSSDNYNLNTNKYNKTSKNYLNFIHNNNKNKENKLTNKAKFYSNSNLKAVSSYYNNGSNESASDLNSPMRTKNHFSSSVLSYNRNIYFSKNKNTKKNSFENLNETLSENKNMSSVNNSNLFIENKNKAKLNTIDFRNAGFNNDYEMGSQYGKKDSNIFIPMIMKKELYSSPRKDKYSLK